MDLGHFLYQATGLPSRGEVDRAAQHLLQLESDPATADAILSLTTVQRWRGGHELPVSSIRPTLAECVTGIAGGGLVASRLKRLPTIVAKLRRFPAMKLSRMEDLGGVRGVVDTPDQVFALRDLLVTRLAERFRLVRERNYIIEPKASGYRGIHLVFSYEVTSSADADLKSLRVEVQLRTRLQHAWATSVEVVGTFRNEDLKSGLGNSEWLRLFALAGDAVAERETTLIGDGGPDFWEELRRLRWDLRVEDRLGAYNASQRMLEFVPHPGPFYLLRLRLHPPGIDVKGFSTYDVAERAYTSAERTNLSSAEHPDLTVNNVDTVLVSAQSMMELRQAYPNYFADTREFVALLYERPAIH